MQCMCFETIDAFALSLVLMVVINGCSDCGLKLVTLKCVGTQKKDFCIVLRVIPFNYLIGPSDRLVGRHVIDGLQVNRRQLRPETIVERPSHRGRHPTGKEIFFRVTVALDQCVSGVAERQHFGELHRTVAVGFAPLSHLLTSGPTNVTDN